jgi:hypothetical protein
MEGREEQAEGRRTRKILPPGIGNKCAVASVASPRASKRGGIY